MENLALRYRPTSWDAIVGQPAVQVILRQMVAKDVVPHAIVLDGIRGSGKTSTARILAAAVNCEESTGPCTHCASCKSIADGNSMDLLEIDAASNGLVEDIRKLREQVLYSVGGQSRVVVLDEAHNISSAGFNALLKTLEEPPPNTIFVLLTTEPAKIPETILSRCMSFTFRKISVSDIRTRLQYICEKERIDVSTDLLTAIAERADGGMRDAIMVLDQVSRVGITSADQFFEHLGELDFAPELIQFILDDKVPEVFALLDEQLSKTGDLSFISSSIIRVFRDMLILRSGGSLACQGDALAARKRLAKQLEPSKILAALKVLWELKTKTRIGTDRDSLELGMVMLCDAVGSKKLQAPTPTKKLTLAEMRGMS